MSALPGLAETWSTFSDPWGATITTIVVLCFLMLLPTSLYLRIVLNFACNKKLQAMLSEEEEHHIQTSERVEGLSPPPLVLLSFANVTYTIKKSRHEILKGITGWFAPHTLTAILGTSGCGKTTLLSVLANQVDQSALAGGNIWINGKDIHSASSYRSLCAYVLQSDNLLESLTVREFLWFAAELRLPAHCTPSQKMGVVSLLLSDLDLSAVANRAIHLLSGGQKRRVTVACELVSRPSLVFLDEPTSGLDASGSLKLVKVLRRLADNGRTVICTIHQPRIDAFALFHMMILMNAGKALYFGPVSLVVPFMTNTLEGETTTTTTTAASAGGEDKEENVNPADFVLDLTHGSLEEVNLLTERYVQSNLCQSIAQTVLKISALKSSGESFAFTQNPDWYPELLTFPGSLEDCKEADDDDDMKKRNTCKQQNMDCCGWRYVFAYPSSFFKQQFTLVRRAMLNEWRNSSYVMTWVLGIIMMLFMGMLYCYVGQAMYSTIVFQEVEENLESWGACSQNFTSLNILLNVTNSEEIVSQCGFDLNQSIQLNLARSSLLYQLLASMFFSEMPLIAMMFADRQLFLREHASKSYSTGAWVLSWVNKFTFAGFLKGLIFPPFVYFSAQLPISAEPYFLFSIFMGIMSIAGSTFALLSVVCFASPESASVAFVVVNVVSQNLCGYFIHLSYIPWWFRWYNYCNFFAYTYEGLIVSQHLTVKNFNIAKELGKEQEFRNAELNAWVFALIAILLCVAFQLVTFLVLAVSMGNPFKKGPTRNPCLCKC